LNPYLDIHFLSLKRLKAPPIIDTGIGITFIIFTIQKEAIIMFEPYYKGTQLIMGDPDSNTAIVSLWSKKDQIAKKIDSKYYSVIGQLYSAERGVDFIIRNLLANPQITNIVITGNDFSNSGVVLMDFFTKGFEKGRTKITGKPCWRIKSNYEGYIDLDIPEESLNELRDSIIIKLLEDITELPSIEFETPVAVRSKQIYEKQEESTTKYYGEDAVFVVRGKTVASVWLQILDQIVKFGKETSTHYDSRQKEIINLISVVTGEDPNNLHIPEFFPFDRAHFDDYLPKVLTDFKPDDVSYTYGTRMRAHFGVDQIDEALNKLVKELDSRAVVVSLWDSRGDLTKGGSPCWNHLWIRVRDNKLFLTTTIRSNDMFSGYPENALALRCLQEHMRVELINKLKDKGIDLDIKLGDLIVNSQSAHLYDDTWESSKELCRKYMKKYKGNLVDNFDPRGNFVITVEDDGKGKYIKVQCVSSDGDTLAVFKGTNTYELIDQINEDSRISFVRHALYLGIELYKAEIAMRHNRPYSQDQPLDI